MTVQGASTDDVSVGEMLLLQSPRDVTGPLNLVHTFHAAQLPGKKMKIIIRGRTPHLMCSHLAWTLQTLPLKTARL